MSISSEQNPDFATDARPVRPVSGATLWNKAIVRRNEIENAVRRVLAEESLDALVLVSAEGNYPPWVKLEAWLPAQKAINGAGTDRERSELFFVVDAKPYRKHELVTTASLSRGRKMIRVLERPNFGRSDVDEWVRFAIDKGPRPTNYSPVADFFGHLVHGVLPFIPAPHNNKVLRGYRNGPFGTPAFWSGLVFLLLPVIGFAASNAINSGVPFFASLVIGIIGLIATVSVVSKRKQTVYIDSQPTLQPQTLRLVDSWHAVVAELGRDYANVKKRLIQAIADSPGMGVDTRTEFYGYRTPNGYEERERLVVSKGQGLVHVHIYPFGNDLFAGWEAYLNWAKWDETAKVSTLIKSGQATEFRELRPAVYIPSQIDLIDLNSLGEFVHRRMERELKALIKERSIDQEIDFKIIRGDRDRALEKSKSGEDGKGQKKNWSYKPAAGTA